MSSIPLVLSLMPGLDLFGRAFQEEGFCVVRGGDPIFGGDVREEHYPSGMWSGVISGPPCQSFSSLAHLVRANGHEPKFGNLIPEFERIVTETECDWFVMENVRQAPVPVVPGYQTKDFLLDNAWLAGEDGYGQEQTRVRRFTFGLRGRAAPDLRNWIDLATLLLPEAERTVTDSMGVHWGTTDKEHGRVRGGPVTATHDSLENVTEWSKQQRRTRKGAVVAATSLNPGCTGQTKAAKMRVKGSNGGNGGGKEGRITPGAGNAGKGRYRLADALRLQGLPENFLDNAPWTADGKLKAVANGVPIPMGTAIARAVKDALAANPPAASKTPFVTNSPLAVQRES